jgi:hypothetical protein
MASQKLEGSALFFDILMNMKNIPDVCFARGTAEYSGSWYSSRWQHFFLG